MGIVRIIDTRHTVYLIIAVMLIGMFAPWIGIANAANIVIPDLPVPLAAMPSADGTVMYQDKGAVIDASNTQDGYIMVKYTGTSSSRLKVMIATPDNINYTYDLNTNGNYETFPFTDGNGTYKVGVYQNTQDTKYAVLLSKDIKVTLSSEYAPYIRPNQYVNYQSTSKVVQKGNELVAGAKTDLDKIKVVYEYVINNLTYDKQKAQTVQSGYVPDVDKILDAKTGICFDYASLMASMLRSQDIPTRLVVGYAGTTYHAWLNVYTKESGWIEGVVYFDGKEWKLMDPTFASSSKQDPKIMEFIGDGKNYTAKYEY